MNRISVLVSALVFGVCASLNAQDYVLSSWTLSSPSLGKAIEVQAPATVCGALCDAGIIPADVLEKDNYFSQDKARFDAPWTFTTKFKTPKKHAERWILEFKGLNHYADIRFNGKLIACADTTYGMFICRQYDVTALMKKSNKIEVTLSRAQKGDLNIGFVDWNPRPLDESMGLTGEVLLRSVGQVAIEDVFVKPHLDTETFASADLDLDITLSNPSDKSVEGVLNICYENGHVAIPVEVPAGGMKLCLDPSKAANLHIDNPRVWWTWDLGTPELYGMEVCFIAGESVSDSKYVTFGVRTITSEVVDNHRQFFLNGRRILIKGAGWSDEIFLRDTYESNMLQARYVKDMGMNTIRFENIWGKDDNIYDCCDELGLLAMVGFSCQWEWEDYCGLKESDGYGCITDQRSMDIAVKYFHDQVIRLHNHASVMCWLTGSDRIPTPELEKRYMEIYNENEYRPYVCSAKDISSLYGGPSGTKMEGPYEYIGPDYWYIDKKSGGAFGFNTETGIGLNIPQIPSLRKMLGEEGLWPLSKVWDMHCTASSSAMNTPKVLTEVINGSFGEAQTLEEYVNRAHALDYDATRAMYEAFRCNVPESTGIIQWMLNSAWPSLYWQQYDYYKIPTAAYYGTRKACRSVQLIYNYDKNAVYAVNESGKDASIIAHVRVFDAESQLIHSSDVEIVATDNTPVVVENLPNFGQDAFLSLALEGEGLCEDNFYCLPSKTNNYNWRRSNWYYTPIKEYADMSFVTKLDKTQLQAAISREGNVITVVLANKGNAISFQNILQAFSKEGEMLAPAFWSDNFVTLLPGQSKTITLTLETDAECEIKFQTWNSEIVCD